MTKPGRYGNLSDLSRMMGVSPAAVTKWRKAGKLKGIVTSTGKIDLAKAKQVLPERRRYGWQSPNTEIEPEEQFIESVDWDRLEMELDNLIPQDKFGKKFKKKCKK